ncbi:MAG TPA: hypothetical protein VK472_01235 [Allosphingosinicella sp.]|nr:hypothetical protein [Allosphingosinicella sp.]
MRTLILAWILAAWMALGATVSAATPLGPAGRWALHASGRTLVVLELKRGSAPGSWAGWLERPTRLQVTNFGFTEIAGPIVRRRIRRGAETAGGIELLIEGQTGSEDDLYVFKPMEDGIVELGFKGAPIPPLILVRAPPDEIVARHWDPERLYSADWEYPSNPRMKAIFDADQADRKDGVGIDWNKVTPRDEARRAETKALLDSGKLRSGDDYYWAAFVFQHGNSSNDYLLAHVLASVAIARGHGAATWISAATLDRYLQNIGQKQVMGTQFMTRDGGTTQDPYDRALISDTLRAALGVPGQADQEKKRAEIEAATRAARPGS